MKYLYKLLFDTGKVFFIVAKTRKRAISKYCEEYGVSKEWVDNHCRVINMGCE